jgi:hypothetical protein
MPAANPTPPAARPLPVFVTLDVGPDDAVLGHAHERAPAWTRTAQGLEAMADVLRGLAAMLGAPAQASWFVRADRHLAAAEGDALAAHVRFGGFLRQRLAAGDTVGWMPQAYSAHDGSVDLDDLATTCARLRAAGWPADAVRMGGCFHDPATMAALAALGVAVDCSALPGREKRDNGWRLDWRGTPAHAYFPSMHDYRRGGSPARELLELPLSMIALAAPYDTAPLARYFNPAMHPALLAPHLDDLAARTDYVQCVLHPDELVPPTGPGHPLVAYSAQACADTLGALCERIRAHGREPWLLGVRAAPQWLGAAAARISLESAP